MTLLELCLSASLARAEVRVARVFSDHMALQRGGKPKTSLVLNINKYHRPNAPLDRVGADPDEACGGFALELGDAGEYPDFAAFQRHIASAKLDVHWDAATRTVNAACRTGNDRLEAAFAPGYTDDWDHLTPTDQCFPVRRVNGVWPHLPKDVERGTALSQMGQTGRVAKGGAALEAEAGRMGYVEVEPGGSALTAYTPLPDATTWRVEAPAGFVVRSAGMVGLLRVIVRPEDRRVVVEHANRPGAPPEGLAKALVVRGMGQPRALLNGKEAPVDASGRMSLTD